MGRYEDEQWERRLRLVAQMLDQAREAINEALAEVAGQSVKGERGERGERGEKGDRGERGERGETGGQRR